MEIYYMPCFGIGYGFSEGLPRLRLEARLTGGGIDCRFRGSSRPIRAHSWHIWQDKPGKAAATVRNHWLSRGGSSGRMSHSPTKREDGHTREGSWHEHDRSRYSPGQAQCAVSTHVTLSGICNARVLADRVSTLPQRQSCLSPGCHGQAKNPNPEIIAESAWCHTRHPVTPIKGKTPLSTPHLLHTRIYP